MTPWDSPFVPLMWASQTPYLAPVVAQAARELGQQGVVLDRLEDARQIVRHGRKEAGRKLRVDGSRIEEGRRRAHEVERRQQFVELDGPLVRLGLLLRQSHRHTHEKRLRQFDARATGVKEVSVVEGLQPKELELLVPFRCQGLGQPFQIEDFGQCGLQQFAVDAGAHVAREIGPVLLAVGQLPDVGHVGADQGEHLVLELAQDQSCTHLRVVGFLFNQGARRHNLRRAQVLRRDVVVDIACQNLKDIVGGDAVQTVAGLLDLHLQALKIQRLARAIGQGHHQLHGQQQRGRLGLGRPFPGAVLAIDDVAPGHLLMVRLHQDQFDLILDFLDGHGQRGASEGPLRHPLLDCIHDGIHPVVEHFALQAALFRQEGLHDGVANPLSVIGNHAVRRVALGYPDGIQVDDGLHGRNRTSETVDPELTCSHLSDFHDCALSPRWFVYRVPQARADIATSLHMIAKKFYVCQR